MIARHFPPDREVGGLRALRIARALTDAGHRVCVVRAQSSDETGALDALPLLTVRNVRALPSLRELYAFGRRSVRGTFPDAAEITAPEAWVPPEAVHPFKRFLTSLAWLPDDDHGFIWPAALAAADTLRTLGPRAVLYSTSPPHSAHVAGLLARVLTGARWIVEFRDPWTGNPGKSWFNRSSFSDAVERWLERTCLRQASAVVGVSEGICRQLDDKLTRYRVSPPPPVVLARNGIDRLRAPAPPANGRPFRIVHAGSLYLGRDPRPFFDALARVARRRGLGPTDLRVEFVGDSASFDGLPVRDMIEAAGLEGIVHLEGWVPHAEARARLESADLLLLLAEGQPIQVPNKLYEYLGTGRPLFVFADRDGETASMIAAVGRHWVVDRSDPDRVEALLEAAIDRATPEPTADYEAVLDGWQVERQIAKVVHAVQEVSAARR